MALSIFTSRIILDALGIDDYGIYNVVGGFVSMFSLLSGTLVTSSQRFIAFEIGKEQSDLKKVFSTIVSIHFFLAIIILVILETLGLWFFNTQLNIDSERLWAARWVFHCSVITFCINLISIPYNATIVAYEKMTVFAYAGIFEAIAKLGAAYMLYLIAYDSLIVYAVLMLVIAILLRLFYGWYCRRKFEGCRYSFIFDRGIFKEIFGFSSWNFIGSTATVLNTQGINLLVNIFFGVAMNAARGVALQVDNAINTFVQNFMMALNPQITKSYAAGDYESVNKINISGTKLAFFLFWIISLPVFFNVDFILSVWLKEVPLFSSSFIKLGILYNLELCLSQTLYTTMLATGKIKKYQIYISGISLLAFPFTWLMFKFGYSVKWSYWSLIILYVVLFLVRLYLLEEMVPQFNGKFFIKKVVLRIAAVIIPASLLCYTVHSFFLKLGSPWFVLLADIIVFTITNLIFVYTVGIENKERLLVVNLFKSKFNKSN